MERREMNRKEIGEAGESLACEVLCRQGYRILCRNYRMPIRGNRYYCRQRRKIDFRGSQDEAFRRIRGRQRFCREYETQPDSKGCRVFSHAFEGAL